jgi:hypothetical protein
MHIQNDTKCLFGTPGEPNFVGFVMWRGFIPLNIGLSGGVNGGGIHEHDRNIIPDGIHALAFAAFQALAVHVEHDRRPANRTDQHVEQILRNHGKSL